PAARRTVRAPHGLNLVPLEELWQLVLILRGDAGERDGEVVPERQIRLAARLVLTAAQDLEDELVALLPVLAEERLDVFESRRLERFEAVPLVHTSHKVDDVLAAAYLVREEVARAGRRL